MKFILLSVVCLVGVAVAKPAITKQKRDILPGDPRYGTDYHHKHHQAQQHQQERNQVETSQAIGGYIGSHTGPESSSYASYNVQPSVQSSYGPAGYTAGQPIAQSHVQAQPQIQEVSHHQVQVQVPSYPQQSTISVSHPVVYHQQQQQVVEQPNYVLPAQPVVQKTVYQHVQIPAQNTVNSYGAAVSSYESQAPQVQHHEHHQVPEVRYQPAVSNVASVSYDVTPVVSSQPQQETVQQPQVQQEIVHHESPAQIHVQTESHAPVAVQNVQAREQVNYVHHEVQPAQNQVNSYGASVSSYESQAPQVQHHEHVPEVRYQPAVSNVASVSYDVTPVVSSQPQQETVQHTQVQQEVVQHEVPSQVYVQTESHAQSTAQNVQTREQVNHVHFAVEPIVQHEVREIVQHFVQPAPQQQQQQQQHYYQQSAQQPQSYSTGSFVGFENYGSSAPQTYNSGFENVGFGFQRDLSANHFAAGFSAGQLQQETVHHVPQVHSFVQTQQIPQRPAFVQSPQPQLQFVHQPAPVVHQPAPVAQVIRQPAPVAQVVRQPAPAVQVVHKPAPAVQVVHQPAPVVHQPAPVVHQPAPVVHQQVQIVHRPTQPTVESTETKQVQPTASHVESHSYENVPSQPIGSNGGYVY